MFKDKMNLTIRILTLPLVEDSFYKHDYIMSLHDTEDVKSYRDYYRTEVVKSIYGGLHKFDIVNNLDEIDLLFEKFHSYYGMKKFKNINKYYINLISKLSKCFICHRNGKIAFKYWESEKEESFIGPYSGINKAIIWNSLNRILNTDLLVVNYLIENGMNDERYLDGYYNSIALEDIQLEKVLQKGVAETHIHRGAGINFYLSWIQLMSNVSTKKAKAIYKKELFEDLLIGSNSDLSINVKKVAIVRIIMAKFLEYMSLNLKDIYFRSYICFRFEECNFIESIIDDIYDGKNDFNDECKIGESWDYILNELGISLYNDDMMNLSMDEDILSHIHRNNIRTTHENIFLMKCLNYINDSDDGYFSKIFWQYIRIKNHVLALKVQGNSIKGLDYFSDYYNRSTEVYLYDQKEYWKLLMNIQLQSGHIKKIEFRTSFGKDKSKNKIKKNIKNTMISFFDAYLDILSNQNEYHDLEYPRIGLVFHMIKMYDNSNPEKCWRNFKNKIHHDKEEILYKDIQLRYKTQIEALNEIREEIPYISEYIVGIDAASVESRTEPWVFAPVYRSARDSSVNKLFVDKSRLKNLGFTYHVGEDFRHLITGLRNIDEVLEHFSYHCGDRIGHGIALGVDVEKWYINNQVVVVPRIEYLENLLWIWGLYKDGLYSEKFDLGYLELEIMKLAEQIYLKADGITVYSLWKSYQSRFKEFQIYDTFSFKQEHINNSIFCKNVDSIHAVSWNEEKLKKTYHCKCYLMKMMEPIQIKITKDDIERLKNLQRIIINKINKKGIIVESNPTSNSIIGSVENIFEHYIHNLNCIDNSADNLMVSINSDDPSVFNTNVSNEFAYIYYSLHEKGYNREDILDWIEKIRNYGMESSFIDNRVLTVERLKSEIKGILDNLKNM